MNHSPTPASESLESFGWSEDTGWPGGIDADRRIPGHSRDAQVQERFSTDAAGTERITENRSPAGEESRLGVGAVSLSGSTKFGYHLAAACSLCATVLGVLLVAFGSLSRPVSLPGNRGAALLVGWPLVAAGIASAAALWTRATMGSGWGRSALVGVSASILAVLATVAASSMASSGIARSGAESTVVAAGGASEGRQASEPGTSPPNSDGQPLAQESREARPGHADSVHGGSHPSAPGSGGFGDGISPGDAALLVRVRAATAKYESVEVARSEGFSLVVRELPGMGAHFVRIGATPGRSFDPERPNLLLYRNEGSSWKLMAVGYILAKDAFPKPPDTFEGAHWHSHQWLCIFGSGSVGVMPQSECSSKGGFWVEDTGWMLHVWLYEENPSGIFAELNPKV